MTEFIHESGKAEPYHYTDSGLDNIWLIGGVERHETPYGPATSITNADELHAAIGLSIARSETMSGKEFRFLRVELDFSQRTVAGLLKATIQQVHRWETGKSDIPGPAQVALCGYYLESLDPESRMKDMMDQLASLDATLMELEDRYFSPMNNDWVMDHAC